MVWCDSCEQYCWALLLWSCGQCSHQLGGRGDKPVWCYQKPHPFTPSLFPGWHRWIFRLFSNIAWFLTWKLSCQLSICLTGVTMFICLQSLKSVVIVVYPDKHCHCYGSLQKKQTDNSLQAHFCTNTHTRVCINMYAYMLNWEMLGTLSNVNTSNEIWKTSRAGRRTKPQLCLKAIEIFPLISVKQRFSLPVFKVILFH